MKFRVQDIRPEVEGAMELLDNASVGDIVPDANAHVARFS
jgi:hypothetical protein